ncbi:MAG: multifunctional oxoglutarate decarboxylase/oxoglutarate dehydrogenase thiamine pyrophosphate-binding subunit/dihydrolipoyllysine-residue succinyltransferase subunit [Propionibacteriaceae bacterium]|jgi:2-oxoglutarate dehydrogenase E1 component|nr:multifunctional oxoglutarate decarboxylase/oxoglutarate dehydrogenase thiamine pyrophosphate-binding subunit/dihydrolipoyllysine-residue succinyltransferase subunit [Propionibacteriaceae bacterium]
MLAPSDFGANAWLIEDLRESWLENPDSVDPRWAAFFTHATATTGPTVAAPSPPAAADLSEAPPPAAPSPAEPDWAEPDPAPHPILAEPDPVLTEPILPEPEPAPYPVLAQPVSAEPEPAPYPISAQPDPVSAEPDPASAEPDPVSAEPDPVLAEPILAEPVLAGAAPAAEPGLDASIPPPAQESPEPVARPDADLIVTPLSPDNRVPFSLASAEPLLPAGPPPQVEPEAVRAAGAPRQRHRAGLTANVPDPTRRPAAAAPDDTRQLLKRADLRTAQNMDASLAVPTATSVRTVPMKLAIDLRQQLNNHLAQTRGGRISFTHLIAFAMVQAMVDLPAVNVVYDPGEGQPARVAPGAINLGLAIDVARPDGNRQLLVPNVKQAESLDFNQFVAAYDDVVRRALQGRLTADDFAHTSCTLTNPGTIGTGHSVPRLMPGQSLILGVGAINYAPGFQGASPNRLNDLGISKVTTLTSTYDHRVIQGAQSGEFLRRVEELLIGRHDFYRRVFAALRVPYSPLSWDTDVYSTHEDVVAKPARVADVITAYRTVGHLIADTDPLLYRQRSHPDLELARHGLTIWDLDREFAVGSLGAKPRQLIALRDLLEILRDAYCRTIGVEYMHITDPAQRSWLQKRLEQPRQPIAHDEHMRILDRLNEAELFETFLQTKFVGQKRFSLEGSETTIVVLDQLCEQAAGAGLDEVCVGMPHRGRLNVLANIVGKSYSQIFQEFDEHIAPGDGRGSGDVKYHLGAEGRFTSSTGQTVKTSVAANPSHLETVDPVLEGIARAKQDRSANPERHPVLPVLLHGDAAFAGQGVVYETFQMSQLRGYSTGGTVHVVVNNQIGFTTAPVESRSSTYCTDVAKAVQAPVFHVNGDDADACVRVARLAFAYRQAFHKDVVIDVVCYRRRGHNEGDDPSFTQPLMYDLIAQKQSARQLYTQALIGRGDISTEDAEAVARRFRDRLEAVFKEVREAVAQGGARADDAYSRTPSYPAKPAHDGRTAIDQSTMELVAAAHLRFPEGFTVHPKVLPQLERRAERIRRGPIDWATAELLAFGSLLVEGCPVRLAGQDARRGTFSQRFGAIVDRQTNWSYVPLKHLSATQASFDIFDSLLSEYAALGFEYGYSVAAPGALICWEAQFGDFANTAQAVADEFIAAGAAKWQQKSGVVLLLPHGFEGQGPDHSSARIERWLQLCSEGALAVCQPSTPASHFHLLRTHAYVNWHRPLVIATPKWMLRHPAAVSQPQEFTSGQWRHVLGDPTVDDPARVRRVLLCSGKIRWELVRARDEAGLKGQVAILSLERLYPLPTQHLVQELAPYGHVKQIFYVQDEPANQGAWWFMSQHLPPAVRAENPNLNLDLIPVTRPAASAPAVGSHHEHDAQQHELLAAALN